MSDITITQNVQGLKTSRNNPSFTGVTIHAGKNSGGKDLVYTAGNSDGYVLEVENPWGTQALANAMLASLKLRGAKYNAFTASKAYVDPAVEIGDNVVVDSKNSVVLSLKNSYTRKMPLDVSAPYSEEVDHAFKYEPKQTREFKRESAYTRARLSITQEEIKAEVARTDGIASSLAIQADRITSEVLRATSAEGALGTRIDQRLDSITLSVTSTNGSSTFTLKDGTTTLDTKTIDITCDAINISGQLTASQIAAGAISIGKLDADAKSKLVVESQARTQYYLSTSSSSATGGSWLNTMPTWTSGKYIWTRERTYNKFADNSSEYKYSPDENGRYDKNLTEARGDADAAQSEGGLIYHSTAGGTIPSAPSAWVTDATGGQNKWTTVRPVYDSNSPALYIATQKKTVGGAYSCTTPALDVTTTVIDGSHITTGVIDAQRIAVSDLSAFNATVGGWTINGGNYARLSRTTDTARIRFNAYTSVTSNTSAIGVATKAATDPDSAFEEKFKVSYGGKVTCSDIEITGGNVGGINIPTTGADAGKLIIPGPSYIAANAVTGTQIKDAEISRAKFCAKAVDAAALDDAAVVSRVVAQKAITTAKINDGAVATDKVDSTVSEKLTYANNYYNATVDGTTDYPTTFTARTVKGVYAVTAGSSGFSTSGPVSCASLTVNRSAIKKKSITVRNSAGTGSVTIYYLGADSAW